MHPSQVRGMQFCAFIRRSTFRPRLVRPLFSLFFLPSSWAQLRRMRSMVAVYDVDWIFGTVCVVVLLKITPCYLVCSRSPTDIVPLHIGTLQSPPPLVSTASFVTVRMSLATKGPDCLMIWARTDD